MQRVRLICREKLNTHQDVEDYIDGKQAEIKELGFARQKCYNRLRRCTDEAEIIQIKSQRDKLTAAMASCRKDIKTAEDVLFRGEKMRENLKREHEMHIGRTQNKNRERSFAR